MGKRVLLVLCFFLIGCERNRFNQGSYADLKIATMGQSVSVAPANNHPRMGSQAATVNGSNGPLDYGISWFYLGDLLAAERGVKTQFFVLGEGGQTTDRLIEKHFDQWEAFLSANTLDALIWIQGESDQGERVPREVTQANYFKIFRMFNRYLPPERIFLVKTSAVTPIQWSPSIDVIQVQEEIIQAGLATFAFNLDKVREHHPEWFGSPPGTDAVHAEFDGMGHLEHAKMWLKIFQHRI